jgi:hypothetical protein
LAGIGGAYELDQRPKILANCSRVLNFLALMPLNEVAETFDPRTTCFDVVIIDEATAIACRDNTPYHLPWIKPIVRKEFIAQGAT